jgi:hypothetical protein
MVNGGKPKECTVLIPQNGVWYSNAGTELNGIYYGDLMNERIKLLAEQAGFNPYNYQGSNLALFEKFAELIVRECAKLNKHQSYELMGVITDVEEGDGFDDVCLNTVKRVAEHLAKDLKEHFGVEE